jgi:peptidoglycan/LPS O-acetylase OafA/YrhL
VSRLHRPALRRRLRGFWPASAAANPIPALDGLRAVAVLTVMLFHAWYKGPALAEDPREITRSLMWSGHTAVQLFFVLSAFLLFLPYAQWLLDARPAPSALGFYRRRALRVGPAFWISLCVLVLVGPLTLSRLGHAAAHAFFVFNFIPGSSSQFNDVYWTMAVEVQFYALLPLIARTVNAVARRFGVPMALGALAVGGLAVSMVSAWIAHRYSPLGVVWYGLAGQYSVSLWMSAFAAGIVASVVYVAFSRPATGAARTRATRRAGTATAASLLLCAILLLAPPLRRLPVLEGNDGLAFGWAFAVMIPGMVLGPSWLRRPLEWRPVRFVGSISYSLYIWHMVVFGRIAPHLSGLPSARMRVLVGFAAEAALCIPIAFVSYQLTERPFMHLGRPRRGVERPRVTRTAMPIAVIESHKPQVCIENNVA